MELITGKITSIVFPDGKIKCPSAIGWTVSFYDDIALDKSMLMFKKDSGYISTSRVAKVERSNNRIIVHTKNSIYYIDLEAS